MNASINQARKRFLESDQEMQDGLMPIVDAHHHFWDVKNNPHHWLKNQPRIPFRYGDYEAICCDFLPGDYSKAVQKHHVIRHVAMEGEWNPLDPVGEALWMHRLASKFGKPHAMSAQIWLDRNDLNQVLEAYAQEPLLGFVKSVRHKPRVTTRQEFKSNWSEPGSMRCGHWRNGYARLADHQLMFELQCPWWHLDEAIELANDFPSTKIIINHAGLPATRDAETVATWSKAMGRISECQNVFVKISGLGVAGKAWTVEAHKPIVQTLIDQFGVDRCMFASNYPVDALVTNLDSIWSGFKQLTKRLNPTERLAIFCDTAVNVYQLK